MRVKKSPKLPVRLYKVIIEKLIINKPKPTERERLHARRVVVVSAATVDAGVDHLRKTLTEAGAFNDTTGVILGVEPAPDCVVLST